MIYRDLELMRSSKDSIAKLMEGLFKSRGKITDMYCYNNGFPDDKFSRWSTFYRLSFPDQDSLDRFHSIAFATEEPEQITLN